MKTKATTTKNKAPAKRSPEFKRRKTYGIPPGSPDHFAVLSRIPGPLPERVVPKDAMSPELTSSGRTRLQMGEPAPKHEPFEYDLTPETLRVPASSMTQHQSFDSPDMLRQRIHDIKYPFGTAPREVSPVPGWKTEVSPPISVDWRLSKSVLSIPVPAAPKIPLWRVWWNAFLDTFKK